MSPYWTRLSCLVLTPEGTLCRTDATHVSLPATDGRLGILDGHAPMLATLGEGVLTVDQPDGPPLGYWVDGGFAQVVENAVTVLAERCEPMETIDPEQTWDQIEWARALPVETAEQFEARQEAIYAAQRKFKAVQVWRRERRGPDEQPRQG